jgi:hypothetical protein
MSTQIDFKGMGNAELLSDLERLVRANRSSCAKLVLHLAEVDARRLYREQAYSCLFEYCVRALRMSESEAYLRIDAARRSRSYPILIELLEAGELNLTSIRLIGPHLTQANHLQVLDRVRGKSKREVEQLVAELAPQPDAPASLRRLPERAKKGRVAATISLAERLALRELPLAAAAAPVTDSPVAASVESIAAAPVSDSPSAPSGTFVGDNGQRCDARGFLELHHHEVTYARGGEASVENLRLMCRCHNALLAERDYGARYMEWRVSSAVSERRNRTASANS